MNRVLIFSLFLCLPMLFSFQAVTNPPVKLSWDKLQDIDYEDKYIEQLKGYMLFPKYSEDIKNLEGKLVDVEGYVVPLDKTGATVALSANPYAACYFCGKSGPASVMTIKLKTKNTKYKIDDYRTFRGKLKLNVSDITQFYYIMEESVDVTSAVKK